MVAVERPASTVARGRSPDARTFVLIPRAGLPPPVGELEIVVAEEEVADGRRPPQSWPR